MNHILIDKLKQAVDFTEHEKSIAAYILINPDEFQKLNCEMLGKATFTSKSTVVRLCKKLGVSGYQELKKILYFEMQEYNKVSENEELTLNAKSSSQDILRIVPQLYEKSIQKVNVSNDMNQFRRILNRMSKMEQIDFYGTGLGYTLFEIASQKFNAIGIESRTYNNLNERYLMAHPQKNKMMAFVLTFSGNNPLTIREAEFLKKIGIYVVGIIGPFADEITKYCDEVISIAYEKVQYETEMIMLHHTVSYLLDLFFTGMLVKDYENIRKQQHFHIHDLDSGICCDTKVSKKIKDEKKN